MSISFDNSESRADRNAATKKNPDVMNLLKRYAQCTGWLKNS